jgi:L-amino acid N-acyltransferase
MLLVVRANRYNFSHEFVPFSLRLVDCTYECHANAILAIFNDAILTSTALYVYKPRDLAFMEHWFLAKRKDGFPIVGVEAENGELMGFASYGAFRAWPAFKYSVEHSVYIATSHRGKDLSEALMRALIERARQAQVHILVGGIDAANSGSIAMHRKLGFYHAGTIKEAGFKLGRWLDLAFYQLILDTQAQPVDG